MSTMRYLTAVLLVIAGIGCAVHPPAGGSLSSTTQTLGLSEAGRPISMVCFNGAGDPATPGTVLIFAAIHGDEGTSAYCASQLIDLIRKDPAIIGDRPVAILPVANPDGLAAHTRYNARGVDLNRNFPSANMKTGSARASTRGLFRDRNFPGAEPASEPETRILMSLIDRLHPARICTIHSIGQGHQQNNYDGPAKSLAELMTLYNAYPASPNIGYPTPGSFGAYAGIDRQIPVITLELPARQPGPEAWKTNRAALIAFIKGR